MQLPPTQMQRKHRKHPFSDELMPNAVGPHAQAWGLALSAVRFAFGSPTGRTLSIVPATRTASSRRFAIRLQSGLSVVPRKGGRGIDPQGRLSDQADCPSR